jgi:oligopeptide/dipeptide ABC transporter ATP-binding protein
VYTVGNQIAEMFQIHQGLNKQESHDRAIDMLTRVKMPSPRKRVREHPHQLSGGMRQRVMIAMSLACNPEILIADEPTTALDVTIQAQILELIFELKEQYGAAVLMITHDLGVIAEIAQRVVVMYAGKVVEEGPTRALFDDPKHPYTKGLLKSIPILGRRAKYGRNRLTEIPGMVPSVYELPQGCSFQPRCQECLPVCVQVLPDLKTIDQGRKARCHLY